MFKYIFLLVTSLVLFSCSKEIIQHKLSVNVTPTNGGSVTPPSNSYEKGQSLQMLATPAGEYLFKEWQGDLSGASNPSTLVIDKDKVVTGTFEKRQYALNLTIDGEGTVKEEIIKIATLSQYPSGTNVRLTPQPIEGWEFFSWSGDISNNTNPLELNIDKPINIKALFVPIKINSILITNHIDTLSISQLHKFKVEGLSLSGHKLDLSNKIKLEVLEGGVTILEKNDFTVFKSGKVRLNLKYENISTSETFYASSIYFNKIPSSLQSNGKCKNVVNVSIIRLLATTDGINLDEKSGPDSRWEYNFPSLEVSKQKFNDDNVITKNSIEYGSRFRDYGTGNVNKYVCLNVVQYVDVFEYVLKPYNLNSEAQKTIDFFDLFQRINLKSKVENNHVKEVWINFFYKGNFQSVIENNDNQSNSYWNIEESNMSSPFSGDISNTRRDNTDLPVYNKSYVVYAHYGQSGVENNLHVRGHQIEAQLYYLDKSPITFGQRKLLFSDLFVGSGNGANSMPLGRVGMTHFPPNTIVDYDYNNSNYVLSDIIDWKPNKEGGVKKLVNAETWKGISYPFNTESRFTKKCGDQQCVVNYNNDPHFKWMIYWFQSIPGENNNLIFNHGGIDKKLSNWWDLFYNWDEAVKNKKTLWIE